MDSCRRCKTAFSANFKFCFNCGDEVQPKCNNCGQNIKKEYLFCPACGKNQRKRVTDTEIGKESASATNDKDFVSDVKRRLLQMKSEVPSTSTRQTKVKALLICQVGIKEKRCGQYVQVKHPGGGGTRKISIPRHYKYQEVIELLLREFKPLPDQYPETAVLLGQSNEVLDDTFSLEEYSHKYMGATRLYLGFEKLTKACQSPPPPPKQCSPVLPSTLESPPKPVQQPLVMSPQPPVLTPQKATFSLEMIAMRDVIQYIQSGKFRDSHAVEKRKGFVTVFARNVAVQRYIDMKEEIGIITEITGSDFALIPENDFDEFIKFTESFDKTNLLYINIPLLYFLKVTKTNPINLEVISNKVVKVSEQLYNEYKVWYKSVEDEQL